MCGRYYVDDDTTRKMEKLVREVDVRLKNDRAGDVYPSQEAAVMTGRVPGFKLEADELSDGVYNDEFLEFALHKMQPLLLRQQEYEQQSLF